MVPGVEEEESTKDILLRRSSRKRGPGAFSRFLNLTRRKRQLDDDDDDDFDAFFDTEEEEDNELVLTTPRITTPPPTTTTTTTTTTTLPPTTFKLSKSTFPSQFHQRTVRQADDDDEDNNGSYFGSGENGSGDATDPDDPVELPAPTTKKSDSDIGFGKRK